jgi:hypothetical protein
LLEGIFMFSRIDFLFVSGEGTRMTETGDEFTFVLLVEAVLFGRDIVVGAGALDAIRDARERRERPAGMMTIMMKSTLKDL